MQVSPPDTIKKGDFQFYMLVYLKKVQKQITGMLYPEKV